MVVDLESRFNDLKERTDNLSKLNDFKILFERSTAFSDLLPRPIIIAKSSASESVLAPFFLSLTPGLLYQGISFILIEDRLNLEN